MTTARYKLRAEADPNPELDLDLRKLGMLRRYGYYLGLPKAMTSKWVDWGEFIRSIDEIT